MRSKNETEEKKGVFDNNESYMRPFSCEMCNRSFTRKENLKRHEKQHNLNRFECPSCGKNYSRIDTLKQHTKKVHDRFYHSKISNSNSNSSNENIGTARGHSMLSISQIESEINENSPSILCKISRRDLETYIDQYWKYFHPSFPILHRASFQISDSKESILLILAMCAIGIKYTLHKQNFAEEIYSYTLKELEKMIYNPDLRLSDIQAALLIEYNGIFGGDDVCYKKSISLHAQLVAIARETGIFQYNPLDRYHENFSSFSLSERRKRTSYGLYLIDSQMAILLNYPPTLSHYEIKHLLPCADDLWEALSAEEWSLQKNLQNSLGYGTHFLHSLQQTLVYGNAPRPISSFGGLMILMAIHIMIRNMAQYAGILETLPSRAHDTFSRRSQLGRALNGLRCLIPKEISKTEDLNDMWGLFSLTWNLAYIHLHLPDTVITSGIVEVTLPATIATAAALSKPQPWTTPGTALLSNNVRDVPSLILVLVVSHICFFLNSFKPGYKEASPVFTFMFYKAALVAWQIFHASSHIREDEFKQDALHSSLSLKEQEDKGDINAEKGYLMTKLVDDMVSYIDKDSDLNNLELFQKWIESIFSTCDTWGIGRCASASFYSMFSDPNP